MDACLLSQEEVGRLVHYGLQPNHAEHCHISAEEAIAGILADAFELVLSGATQYITRTKLHFIRPVKSCGIPVIQRVVSNHLAELKPLR